MGTPPWLKVALAAVSVLPAAVQAIDVCPGRCVDAGPDSGNWSVYPNFNIIKRCQQTMFYGFSLYDPVDDPHSTHRIAACSSYGTDFDNMESEPVATRLLDAASPVDVDFELGWWHEDFGLAKAAIRSLVAQTREYIDNGHGASDRPFSLYGRSGQATIGVYIGQGLLNQGLSASAPQTFEDNFDALNVTTPSLAMQLCGPGYDSTHIFGVVVTSNATFAPTQNAIRSWANATCLSFINSTSFPGKATITTPLLNGNYSVTSNSTNLARSSGLEARADCRTVQVESGQGCAELAVKCGITGANFEKFNPGICSKLKPKLHVCCSSGTLPDFRPTPGADGSCFAYDVQENDNCANLGAEFSLTNEEIESFNKDTWGWAGCELLCPNTKMCLSKGTPPFPAPIANAACGPQKPGSKPPTDGSNITDLNLCPINACCNIWGQCGITRDFCIDTNTGPPGTAKKGTYGCISNCGTEVVRGTGSGAIKLAYFQGYGLGRKCLYQDALQIDTSKYTHLHFGFGTLTPSYEVEVGDMLSTYQFNEFKRVQGAKRILSFGGWDFSTFPDTYYIFREGVKPHKRMKMAKNIADFIKKHELDGVDIDWEYPGAPDLSDFDPGKAEDGPNYLAFLAALKNLLPGKSVAIAAPASYWYLKQFPIKEISKVVDYIVYMTYDLHGQWDAHNEYSQENCDTGNCLRSQVNLTETRQALAMVTKAGVPGNKIVVGFTGDRQTSYATPGRCTDTAGYIADAEIKEIIDGGGVKRQGRVVQHFLDSSSNSDILVYDNDQWVGYMSENTKAVRSRIYASLGMGGTTDWASDLQESATNIGKWKDYHCPTDVIEDPLMFSTDKDQFLSFSDSVERTLKSGASMACDTLNEEKDNCDKPMDCPAGASGEKSGPAAQFVWNSLITVHKMYHNYRPTMFSLIGPFANGADDMEETFAPVPEEKTNQWLNILIDVITIGTLGGAAPFFNGFLKTLPAFADPKTFDNTKDTVLMLMGQTTTLAKAMMLSPDQDSSTNKDQDKFSNYMNQVVFGWMNATERTLSKLSSGEMEYVTVLGNLMSDGKLVPGRRTGEAPKEPTASELEANIFKTFYGYSIPALWRRSKTYAFVLDSGKGCSGNPASKYVDDDTAKATSVCHDGTLYYLVHPDGEARPCECERVTDMGPCQTVCRDNKFSAPVGLDRLGDFGNIQVEDLVKGSVNMWRHNNKENKRLNITQMSLERVTQSELVDVNIQTAGFVQLPVCSPDRAFQSWDTGKKGGSENYPCDVPPGKDHCGESSFENQGSDASPEVEDCKTIIKNIEGDGSTEFTHRITGHREILKHGSCRFGIERTGGTGGAVEFRVGGQDVIDVINEAIKRFGGGGRVGAKGVMPCSGTTAGTKVNVEWGIY
ncbi:Killer toxin subunits alpha/beta [Diaporthe eres]|nr:Killer toxin subunits alpha/beta [Diaporthe eres]